jgi:hypothetical protein
VAINVGIKVGFQLVSNLVIDGVGRVVGPVCACVCVCVCVKGVLHKNLADRTTRGAPKTICNQLIKRKQVLLLDSVLTLPAWSFISLFDKPHNIHITRRNLASIIAATQEVPYYSYGNLNINASWKALRGDVDGLGIFPDTYFVNQHSCYAHSYSGRGLSRCL